MSPPFCRQTAEAPRYRIRLLFPSGRQIKHFLTMLKDIQDSSRRKSSACNFSHSLRREFILRHFTNDTCKCWAIHIHNLRLHFNSFAIKLAFYGSKVQRETAKIVKYLHLKPKCTQTEICWTLMIQQIKRIGTVKCVTVPQDLLRRTAPGWLPRESRNDILRYLLTPYSSVSLSPNCSHM